MVNVSSLLKWKGTIGIVGFTPRAVVNLSNEIVRYGNQLGFFDDQHFPELLAIGIGCKDKRHLIDQVDLCNDFGCDVIVSPEKIGGSGLDRIVKDVSGVSVIFQNKTIEDLAKITMEKALCVEKPRRLDLIYKKDISWQEQGKIINTNLYLDELSRNQRFKERQKFGGYPLLSNSDFVGVLGGAGPKASAAQCEKLSDLAVPFIHYSQNSAPGKHPFEMGEGPSYIPHYSNAMGFFEKIKTKFVTIPCNTAHMRLEEFCSKSSAKIIDIRESVLKENSSADGLILLGTNRTVGVNLPTGQENEVGIYERLRLEKFPNTKQFFTPSSEQQKIIMSAIYEVKAGKLDEAKIKINGVAQEIRDEIGNQNIPVIFGCTELPLANYETTELRVGGIIDPAESVARAAQNAIFNDKKPSGKVAGGKNVINLSEARRAKQI